MAKQRMRRLRSVVLSAIMLLSLANVYTQAVDNTPDMVRNYSDTYYMQDGTPGSANDWNVHLSKTDFFKK